MQTKVSKLMIQVVPIEEVLKHVSLQNFSQPFKKYGVNLNEDVFLLTSQDWERLKVPPFQRTKIIHAATQTKKQIQTQIASKDSLSNNINNYEFSSNAPYSANHKFQNLRNFQAQGYGVANCSDSHMTFSFKQPIKVYGAIIGNNLGVSGGWNSGYLQGVQIQVQLFGNGQWNTVHTINGMPNMAKTAYLAKIQQDNVIKIRFWKNSYFSTSFVHFI